MTAAPVGDSSKQTFDQAYETLAESERFQTEFPELEVPDPPEPWIPPEWLVDLLGFFGQTGSVWTGLFWLIAGLIAAILAFFIIRTLLRIYQDRTVSDITEDEAGEEWRPEESVARSLLEEADLLAKEGRYAQAARLLLQRSVEDIERHMPNFMRPALTSRDIAESETMPAPARGAFSLIATIVERGIFAARPVDESGWGEAREAYQEFAFGGNWQ